MSEPPLDAGWTAADEWWHGLPGARRAQIHRWVAQGEAAGDSLTEHDQPLPLEGL